MKEYKNILIIRISALGDVAMTIPAIYSLALKYPDKQITVLTKPFFARLFVNRPENISFVMFEDKHRSFMGLMSLIRQLHKMNFDCVADLHNILKSWIIDISFRLCGTKVRMVQKRRDERKRLLHGTDQERRTATEPFIMRYADVMKELGLDITPIITKLPSNGANILPECTFKADGKRWIGIAPFARYENKTYPPEKMKEVVKLLSENDSNHIFLFGSKDDVPTLSEWQSMSKNITCVAGSMSIEEELALMKELDVMVSMDSANMHLASLVGTRVVSIWGSTSYHCGFLGWNQSIDDCIWTDISCQPCTIAGSKKCVRGDLACMHSIKPEDLIKRI